ncbi:DUF3164 family protein [Phocoenobacter skyensis]|uniref:DUF3164 family protein n=1 Tax=Phocoenobacter skyensis TaxID=97481 RepID=A0ABT9JKR7_9PAST|nr:DUF3164 family protein [Pasteurella skyensis]MDP8079543.1 DUF3164 family protein [Pasteurella skyensis]MDP8085415.1 DUF3164 family protein [Pasteurella skyensis]
MSKQTIDERVFWKNAKGQFIPEANVKEIDKTRDELVRDLVAKALEVQQVIQGFKTQTFDDVNAFVELSAEKYNANIGGKKGNITLFTYDGEYKLQVAVAEHIRFDERIHAAKSLIDECLHDWSEGSKPELKVLIDNAFQVDKQGNLSTSRILSLRRVEIDDERWNNAMLAISDSIQVVGSKDYVRFYQRDGVGKYQPISLGIAGV